MLFNDININNIQLYIFNGKFVHGNKIEQTIYETSYNTWKTVWSETFHDLEGTSSLYSDEFTKQTIIASFFYNLNCMGMIFFNKVDFQSQTASDDSYFRAWSPHAKKALIKNGHNILIGSNITSHPHYRGKLFENGSIKNLTLDIGVLVLQEIGFDAMTGTMRCDKGMDEAAFKCGATSLNENIIFHNVPVSLVAFYKKDIKLSMPEVSQPIWKNRIEFKNQNQKNQNISDKKVA